MGQFSIFSRSLGIDLGTSNVLMVVPGKGIVLREPTVVAVSIEPGRRVMAVGEAAHLMVGRTPGSITAVHPMQNGVIADFDITRVMLQHLMQKAMDTVFPFLKPRVVIAVPCGVTEVEKRAVDEALRAAGARSVQIIEEPMAAAIGAGLPVQKATGSMVVDIGGGTTEVAVISLGGIVTARSVRIGGGTMDHAIVQYIKREHNLLIGERTAEEIKIDLGDAMMPQEDEYANLRGRDLVTGLPQTIQIAASEIHVALQEPIFSILEAVRYTLEQTPPELAADIMERGILLSGGAAQLSGLPMLIARETGMPVYLSPNPMDCVVLGAGHLCQNPQILEKAVRGFGVEEE